MRVLLLIDSYPPAIGGAQQHVRNLGAELARRGHTVSVVTFWNTGEAEFSIDQGVRVYRVRGTVHRAAGLLFSDAGRSYAPPFPDPEGVAALRRIIARERPQIVHAHNWMGRLFLPLKTWSGARFVSSLHSWEPVCAKWTYMYRGAPCSGPGFLKCLGCAGGHYGPVKGVATTLTNFAMSAAERAAADMFIPVSRAVAAGTGLAGSRLPFRVIPEFVPDDVTEHRDDADPRLAQLPDEAYLLFVGALRRNKGVEVLLRAYAGLPDAPPLVLIGAVWPDTPATFPPKVTVLQSLGHDAVMSAWRRSLLGIVPSIWPDPCPIVTLEAMASGRPVIGTRIGGIVDEIADGETGFLVPPGDPDALRTAIVRLLTDPRLRERMGEAAQQRAVAFQASTVVPQIEGVYHEVLGNEVAEVARDEAPRREVLQG